MTLTLDLDYQVAANFRLKLNTQLPLDRGIVGIFGESGSGKSSLLSCLAGLNSYDGKILLNQQNLSPLPSHRIPLVLQQQHTRLFPHLSVRDNLKLVQRHGQFSSSFKPDTVCGWCEIDELIERSVQSLSGGERQRVALARTLLTGKPVLLLDEPFTALDWARRQQLLERLRQLHQDHGLSIILVSHSLKELGQCCDYLLQLEAGQLIEQGPALPLLRRLSQQQHHQTFSILEAHFIRSHQDYGLMEMQLNDSSQRLWLHQNDHSSAPGRIQVEANRVSLSVEPIHSSILNHLQGRVTQIHRQEGSAQVTLDIDGQYLVAEISLLSLQSLAIKEGQTLYAHFKAL